MNLTDPSLLECRAFLGGEWVASDARITVRDPARGTILAEVADCTRADASQAIDLAAKAQPDWATHTGKERAAILRRWHGVRIVPGLCE